MGGLNMKAIFCFDGTCNDPEDSGDFFEDSSVSNILKMHAFLGGVLNPLNEENAKTSGQRSFYYSGIGTRGSWLKQKFNSMFAPPEGDMDDILDEADENLRELELEAEDEVYIFGFSRGAAIARMFAAHIGRRVDFLGVFDTVAATRGSLDLNPDTYPASGIVFENGTIGDHVKRAVHVVSIDEKRIAFQPTLFNNDKKVTEVWFAGVHSDVGGGFWFDGLSDITLEFMLASVRDDLTVLDIKEIEYDRLKVRGAQDAICFDDLNINPLFNGKIHEQKRSGVGAKTLSPRLVRVNENDLPTQRSVPIIHHTVSQRFHKVTAYRPYALRDTAFSIVDADGKVGKEIKGVPSL